MSNPDLGSGWVGVMQFLVVGLSTALFSYLGYRMTERKMPPSDPIEMPATGSGSAPVSVDASGESPEVAAALRHLAALSSQLVLENQEHESRISAVEAEGVLLATVIVNLDSDIEDLYAGFKDGRYPPLPPRKHLPEEVMCILRAKLPGAPGAPHN